MKHFLISLLVLFGTKSYFAQDIFEAARTGDLSRIEDLVKIDPDTVNAKNPAGFTPLILAVYRNQAPAATLLLKYKAEVNAGSPEGTALLAASYKGNLELVQLLIDHHADVNVANIAGTTSLMFAAMANNVALVKLLLKHGAKKELVEKSGKTALSYATLNQAGEIMKLLAE